MLMCLWFLCLNCASSVCSEGVVMSVSSVTFLNDDFSVVSTLLVLLTEFY